MKQGKINLESSSIYYTEFICALRLWDWLLMVLWMPCPQHVDLQCGPCPVALPSIRVSWDCLTCGTLNSPGCRWRFLDTCLPLNPCFLCPPGHLAIGQNPGQFPETPRKGNLLDTLLPVDPCFLWPAVSSVMSDQAMAIGHHQGQAVSPHQCPSGLSSLGPFYTILEEQSYIKVWASTRKCFYPRDKNEKNYSDFLGPSWCNIKLDPER